MNPACLQRHTSQQPNAPSRSSSATYCHEKSCLLLVNLALFFKEHLLGDTPNLENHAQVSMPPTHLFWRQVRQVRGIANRRNSHSRGPWQLPRFLLLCGLQWPCHSLATGSEGSPASALDLVILQPTWHLTWAVPGSLLAHPAQLS